ncbi:hypothetical protein D3C74_357700 [compost metagenome]
MGFNTLLVHNGEGVHRQNLQEIMIRIRQGDFNGGIIFGGYGFDGRHAVEKTAGAGLRHTVKGIHHRICIYRIAAPEFHAGFQLESIDGIVARCFPALGKHGLDVFGIGDICAIVGLDAVGDELVICRQHQGIRGQIVGFRRIERRAAFGISHRQKRLGCSRRCCGALSSRSGSRRLWIGAACTACQHD